jgi:outer membrane lipoprotein-sorting protein
MTRLAASAVALLGLFACGCPHGTTKRTYPEPAPLDLVSHVTGQQQRARSLRAETKADVWIGNDRANVTVNILAEWGGKLRFQAENPNGMTAADLASDGTTYCMIDANHNCGECGPATGESVGRLLGIILAPDDIVTVLLGSTPVLDGDATVTWDSGCGCEVVDLKARDGYTQRIKLDGKSKRWDVLEAEVKDPQGKRVFKIRHKEFHDVKKPDGTIVRLPGASLFEQKGESAKIDWRKQELDAELPAEAYTIDVPAGLKRCGQ